MGENSGSKRANDRGQIVSTWEEIGSRRTAVGRKCLLIIWVGVFADRRMTMREGEANRKTRLTGLSDGT